MKHMATRILMLLLVLFVCTSRVQAAIEITLQNSTSLPGKALDVVATPENNEVLVLTKDSEILVFSDKGELKERLALPEAMKKVDDLAISSQGDSLFLTSSKKKTLHVLSLERIYDINVQGAPSRGSENAPVIIVVFSEFQCPYCAKLEPQFEQLLHEYPEQIRIVFKHYPLRKHKFAKHAALASMAAHNQGKFWEFHDLLFANQQKLNQKTIHALARQTGLDMELMLDDMRNSTLSSQLERDRQDALDAGVRGTPTIFVNGRKLKNRNMTGFRTAIDAELAKLNPQP